MKKNKLLKSTIPAFGAVALVFSMSAAAADGEAIYNKVCKMCHASGMMGAPVVGDAAAWTDRIAQGIDTLNSNAINGIGKMKPKGGKKSLSDEDVIAAVTYMVENSQ